MDITEVKIFKANRKAPVLAYANIVLAGKFIIRGVTLLETEKNGRFISMPSRRVRSEEKKTYRNYCHPLTAEFRDELTQTVFEAYDEFVKNEE